MNDQAPDPVSEAAAYQRMLLDALDADDPGDVQSAAGSNIRALVDEAGPDLRIRPAPGEWSALSCLAHIADAEVVMAAR